MTAKPNRCPIKGHTKPEKRNHQAFKRLTAILTDIQSVKNVEMAY